MSKSAAKLEKVRADRDRFFSEGRYYEALQLYKTLYSRFTVKKSYVEAREILVDGATALLQQKQSNAGGELATLLIELFQKSKQECGTEQASAILTLCASFPSDEDGIAAKSNFLKAAIKWSSTPASYGHGHPDFHLTYARTLRAQGEFALAHQQFLRSGGSSSLSTLAQPSAQYFKNLEYIEACQSLVSWAEQGAPSEMDLYVVRAVLQYLCVEDLAGANTVSKWFVQNRSALAQEPLIHFAQFMIECVQRSKDAAPLFDLLKHKYALALSRDPSLDAYLDKIGEVYFGRPAAKDFLSGMLSGLTAAPTTTEKSAATTATSSVSPPAASAADAMVTDVD